MSAIPETCPSCRQPVAFKDVIWRFCVPYCPNPHCLAAMVRQGGWKSAAHKVDLSHEDTGR